MLGNYSICCAWDSKTCFISTISACRRFLRLYLLQVACCPVIFILLFGCCYSDYADLLPSDLLNTQSRSFLKIFRICVDPYGLCCIRFLCAYAFCFAFGQLVFIHYMNILCLCGEKNLTTTFRLLLIFNSLLVSSDSNSHLTFVLLRNYMGTELYPQTWIQVIGGGF